MAAGFLVDFCLSFQRPGGFLLLSGLVADCGGTRRNGKGGQFSLRRDEPIGHRRVH
jgi:hypothetical protein